MRTITHQGVVKETVTVRFENGYSVVFEEGVEISLLVAIATGEEKLNAEILRLRQVIVAMQAEASE